MTIPGSVARVAQTALLPCGQPLPDAPAYHSWVVLGGNVIDVDRLPGLMQRKHYPRCACAE